MKTLKGVDALLFLLDWREVKEATKIEIGEACYTFYTSSNWESKKHVMTSLWEYYAEVHKVVISVMDEIGISIGYNGFIDDYYEKARQHSLRIVSNETPNNGVFLIFICREIGTLNSLTYERISIDTAVDTVKLSPEEVAILEGKKDEPTPAISFTKDTNSAHRLGGVIPTATHGASTLAALKVQPERLGIAHEIDEKTSVLGIMIEKHIKRVNAILDYYTKTRHMGIELFQDTLDRAWNEVEKIKQSPTSQPNNIDQRG